MTFDYLGLLVSKYFGDLVSVRFLMFSLVGASGVLVHLFALRGSMLGLGLDFNVAQTLATFVAMTTNFALNNQLTSEITAALRAFEADPSIGAMILTGDGKAT